MYQQDVMRKPRRSRGSHDGLMCIFVSIPPADTNVQVQSSLIELEELLASSVELAIELFSRNRLAPTQ